MKKFSILIYFCLAAFFIHPLPQSNSLLDEGITNFNKGQYQFAVSNLTKYIQIIEENTDNPKAYYYLSLSYYFLENYRMSQHYIKELSTRFGLSNYTTQSYFWKGLIHQNLKEWPAAEESFLKYIALIPRSELTERAYLAAANSEIVMEKYEAAIKNLKIIIDEYKDKEKYEEASVLYAYILTKLDREKEAEDFLIGWIGRLGENGEGHDFKDRLWLYYAEIQYNSKKYNVAKLFYKKIDLYSKESPSSDIALLRLAQIEELSGNSKDAKEYLVRLSNEYPYSKYNIDGTLSIGVSKLKNNEYKDAMAIFNQAKILAEKNLLDIDEITKEDRVRLETLLNNSIFYIAETYYNQADYDKALEYYQKVLNEGKSLQDESALRMLEINIKINKKDETNKLISKYNTNLIKNSKLKNNYLVYRSEVELLNGNYNQSLKTLTEIEQSKTLLENTSYLKAKNYIKLGKLEDAVKSLEDRFPFLPYNEKSKSAMDLAELNFKLGNYEKVISYSEVLRAYSDKLSKDDRQTLLTKSDFYSAISFMQIKEFNRGISLLESLTKAGKSSSLSDELRELVDNSYYYLGWMYYKTSNYKKSADAFQTAFALPIPKKIKDDSYFMMGWCHYSNREYKKSAEIFTQIYEKLYPDLIGIKALYMAGKSFQNSGDNSKAMIIFNKIYNNLPENNYKDDALYEIIVNSFKSKEFDKANNQIILFKRNFGDSPLYKELILQQAETMLTEKRYSEALSVYDYYIKNFKDSGGQSLENAYYWAGFSAEKSGDYESAKEYLKYLSGNFKNSGYLKETLSLLTNIYKKEKNYADEENTINSLLSLENNKEKLKELNKRLNILAGIKKGMSEEEAILAENALDGTIESKFKLAKYGYENKDKIRALITLKEIAEKDSKVTGSNANMIIANDLFDKENYKEAAGLFLRTVTSYKTIDEIKAEALYKAGFCYYKMNELDVSREIIDRLKSNFPDSTWTSKGKELQDRIK